VSSFPRSVVAVSADSDRAALLEGLIYETDDFDVVIVESVARAYSRIKELTPELVIVFIQIDDVAGCQLLSMLAVDRDTASIPVVTCAIQPGARPFEPMVTDMNQDQPRRDVAIRMN